MSHQTVLDLLLEHGIKPIGKSAYPGPSETRAVATLAKAINKHGIDHGRDILTTLADTTNNKASLEAEVFGAVSDLLRAKARWYEQDPERWLECFDRIPIGELQAIAHDLRGFVPLRSALAGLIYERLWRAFGPLSKQPDLLDERRQTK